MSNEGIMSRSHPFTAWTLGGTFIPKQVKLICTTGYSYKDWHVEQSGKAYHDSSLFETKEQAIASGESRLAEQEQKILKQQASIAKKRANLEKSK
jgi:hypothetical protein